MTKGKIPIYQFIEEDILTKIKQEIYKPGELLPSENQMAEIYETSVPTVRKALSDLVHEKVIFRIKGKGTFVNHEKEMFQNKVATNTSPEKIICKHDTKLCFLVLADQSDSSIMKMIRGAQMYLFNKGYAMSILCGEEGIEDEAQLVRECIDSKIEGIIWFSAAPEGNMEGLKMLKQCHIPVVMLDRGPAQMPFTLVSAYNLDGGYQMGKHLTGLGHQKIIFAADRIAMAAEKDRIKGYRLALDEEGIPFEEKLVVSDSLNHMDDIITLIKEQHATAVQCVNDKVACQMIRRLEQAGFTVPEDISVGGFDDSAEAQYSHPRITTIHQPFEEMGKVAAEKLLVLLEEKPLHSQTYLSVELVINESTDKPGII